MFGNVYQGKRVFITGHTGFKGSWLTIWLLKLGAQVTGFSDCVPTSPSLFDTSGLGDRIDHQVGDIRDLQRLRQALMDAKPDFVFHLAAQAIVSTSYAQPIDTITTNVLGTANVLEALREIEHDCVAVIVTSDKCYENVEWPWGYKETDHLGGKDIYSGSKGAAEIIFHSYFHSFFNREDHPVRLATGRAGNVIGGGDWAKDRIVVDCMRNWSEGQPVEIRSPRATRPWQHVLEPLSGYLTLGATLTSSQALRGESFNFGPRSEQNRTVLDLLSDLSVHWQFANPNEAYRVTADIPFHEAGLLKLTCDKALFHLKWESNLGYHECVKFVSEWYYQFYKTKADMFGLTVAQIEQYEAFATERSLVWAR
ncbi:CDP-glucose 4,6-dehydratase [Roseateles sp.]|uniref:CDP-glucose 4,6-dehydratase n=1 Tax=Roseateles sp. TaxID=1971397 RepID=UPI003BA5C337